jgi:NAD(P)-dependent dehydrogenase (short-subunit alcohol dehydrogenase family)
MRLEGRTALVTGASGGLGSAIAVGLAAEGAAVALHARSAAAAQEVLRCIEDRGGRAVVVTGDVRDPEDVDAMIRAAEDGLGPLAILVNNAGVMGTTAFLDLTTAEWDRVLDTNLKGYFLVGQRAARGMAERGYGRIINVSSTRQVQAWPGSTAYCTSKGGIAMLTRVMALELAPHGICVNSIAPGTFLTDLNRSYLADPEFRAARTATIPAGRLGVPAELVAAAVLLASDDASFIVGASLMIDGGQTLA